MKEVRHSTEILSGLADLWPWAHSLSEVGNVTWEACSHVTMSSFLRIVTVLRCILLPNTTLMIHKTCHFTVGFCKKFCQSEIYLKWDATPWKQRRLCGLKTGLSLPCVWTLHDCGGEKCRLIQMFPGGGDVNAMDSITGFSKMMNNSLESLRVKNPPLVDI